MKKYTTLLLFFLMSLNFFGQKKHNNHQEIHAAKVSFITNKLSLTTEQAEKFWPIYNKSRKEIFSLYREKKSLIKSIDFNSIDSKTSKEILLKLDSIEEKIHTKHKTGNKQLLEIIDYVQLLKLKLAEFKFKRKLLEQIKNKEANKEHF